MEAPTVSSGLLFYTGVWVGNLTKIRVYAFEIMCYSLQ